MILELIIGHKAIVLLFKSINIHVHICESFDTVSQVHECLENKLCGPWHTITETAKKVVLVHTLQTFFTTRKVFSAGFLYGEGFSKQFFIHNCRSFSSSVYGP